MDILLDIAIFILAFTMILYCLFGGVGLGAGILELFLRKHDRKLIGHAFTPAWEANQLWLLLVVVILFLGFPPICEAIGRFLHIPLLVLLIGIILRGATFTWRHYHAGAGRQADSQNVYNWVFRLSSLFSALFIGVVVGASIMGRISREPATFYEGYIAPWLNVFSFMVGVFTVCLFSFLAAVYLIGETSHTHQRAKLVKASKILALASVLAGGTVFTVGEISKVYLLARFLYSPAAIISVLLSALLLSVLWRSLTRVRVWQSRIFAGTELVLVLVAWFDVQSPVVVAMRNGISLTFQNSVTSEPIRLQLVIVLGIVALIVLPSLYYLVRVLKREPGEYS